MIRFGPSGIPLSCKGRTQKDGLDDVHTLGLNSMEIQFVRVNTFPRFVTDEEVGLHPREITDEYIVDVVRKDGKKKGSVLADKTLALQKGDEVVVLVSGVAKDYAELKEIGDLARDLDIQLSIHSPYYMDLVGTPEMVIKSMENLRLTGLLARDLGCEVIVTHLGMYSQYSKEEALEAMMVRMKEIKDLFKLYRITAKLGIEVSGKQAVIGTMEEIGKISKKYSGIIPVINFAHLHARTSGLLKKKEDFQKVFDEAKEMCGDNIFYTHFSGVEHEGGNEKRYTPIKKGDLKFEPLAECILDNDFEITIISGSPLLEHDAMYMKVILERVQLKREIKVTKLEKAAVKEKDEKVKRPPEKVPVKAKKPVKAKVVKGKPKPKPKAAPKKPVKAKVVKGKPKPKPKAAPKTPVKAKPKPKPKTPAKKPVKTKPKPKAKPKKAAKKR
jgi:deoxyribonuclease-4